MAVSVDFGMIRRSLLLGYSSLDLEHVVESCRGWKQTGRMMRSEAQRWQWLRVALGFVGWNQDY